MKFYRLIGFALFTSACLSAHAQVVRQPPTTPVPSPVQYPGYSNLPNGPVDTTPANPTPAPAPRPTPSYTPVARDPLHWSPREDMTRWSKRFSNPEAYFRTLSSSAVAHSWALPSAPAYLKLGPVILDGYPWYIEDGHRHRYNPLETCSYGLVDATTYKAQQVWDSKACDQGYDACIKVMDAANTQAGRARFICAEKVN